MNLKPPPTEKRPRRWYRFFLAGFVVLLSLATVAWWYRPLIFQIVLQEFLNRTALVSPKISGLQLGFDQAELAEMTFGIKMDTAQITAKLQTVKITYRFDFFDFTVPKVDAISIGNATLTGVYEPKQTQNSQALKLALPFKSLTISNLDLTATMPWGKSHFLGMIELDANNAEKLQIHLENPQQNIRIQLDSSLRLANMVLDMLPDKQNVELNTENLDQSKQQLKIHGNISKLVTWASTSPLLPETLKTKISASTSWLNPNLSGLQVDIDALSNNNFTKAQGRLLLTRDKRYLSSTDWSLSPSTMVMANTHLAMAATELHELTQAFLPKLPDGVLLSNGKVEATAQWHWQAQQGLSGSAHINAFDLTLAAGNFLMEHAGAKIDIADFNHKALAGSVDIRTLQMGKELLAKSLSAQGSYHDNQLKIESGIGSIFGGQIEVLPTQINTGEWPIVLTLRVHAVDLAQLLANLHYEDLTASGSVNGELPLRISKQAIELQDGTLIGIRPGVLRYQGPVADKENIAFKALRNLQYKSLQAKANYQPNGDYRLGLRLEGNNPEVLSGHALAFNLNISGRLPELLQKGIMAGDFEKAIMRAATTKIPTQQTQPQAEVQQPKPPRADRRRQ